MTRIVVTGTGLVKCSAHGDSTECEVMPSQSRPVYARWECVECGVSRTFTVSGDPDLLRSKPTLSLSEPERRKE